MRWPAIGSFIGRLLRPVRAGDARSVAHDPRLRSGPSDMRAWSSSFADGEPIPIEHAGEGVGDNRSPALAWTGVPSGTVQLLLIVEDTDVPLPRPLIHTIALIDADRDHLEAGDLRAGQRGIRFIPAGFGRTGYHGPRPIPGHGVHHYGIHLHALDQSIPADSEVADFRSVLDLVDGHVMARARVVGTMSRP